MEVGDWWQQVVNTNVGKEYIHHMTMADMKILAMAMYY